MGKSIKLIHWLPRIICIIAILFVSLFAADAFSPELTFWQQLGAFVIQLIPSFILLFFLIVAWRREYVGGIIFMIVGLGTSPFVFILNYRMNHSIWLSSAIILFITIPFVVVGFLFVVSYFLKKKNQLTASRDK